jgi:type II secretory pathway pseudopilin PulG
MTLVELLVVVAILGMLAVTVLPNLSATADNRRGREAARTVATVVMKAQSQAVGRSEWSGFAMVPASALSWGASDLFFADVPPVYRGDTVDASLTVAVTGSTCFGTCSGNALQTLSTGSTFVAPRDLIRFSGRGPFYEITDSGTGGIAFRMRTWNAGSTVDNAGQTAINTPWPSPGIPLAFEVHRKPVLGGAPTTLSNDRVIDLRWSGCGPRSIGSTPASYRRFVTSSLAALTYDPVNASFDQAGSTVSILFDGTGRLRQIMIGPSRYAVNGMIFLLVGRVDRAGGEYAKLNSSDDSLGANWQYADSYWVAIDPMTGVTKTAECRPDEGVAAASLTNLQKYGKLIDSQQFVREQFD